MNFPIGEMMIDENKFWELVRTWEFQTKYASSATVKLSHSAVNEIIQMGSEAIPLILKAMNDNFHLTYVLHKLTGEWPVRNEYAGDGPKIIESWRKWAKKRGYQI